MKISGFTIIRNAVINDYPVVEAITSVLPVVDEMIVSIGDSDDATEALIRSIASDKIKIVYSTWDMSIRKGGEVLAIETNKAFSHVSPDADWAFYIQADEVVHEKYHDAIRKAALQYKDDKEVEGLLFKYLHFYGTFDYVGDSRRWYNREVRIIRNDKNITAYLDAQGFRKMGEKLQVKLIDAYVYHYGWVKSPKKMREKQDNTGYFWHDDDPDAKPVKQEELFDFNNHYDSLEKFAGSHPQVMQQRVSQQNWNIVLDTDKKYFSFKDRILYWIEKKTGVRLFDFRNYKII